MNPLLFVIPLVLLPMAVGAAIVLAVDRPNWIELHRRRRATRQVWDEKVQQILATIGHKARIGDDLYWVTITGQTWGKITGQVVE